MVELLDEIDSVIDDELHSASVLDDGVELLLETSETVLVELLSTEVVDSVRLDSEREDSVTHVLVE